MSASTAAGAIASAKDIVEREMGNVLVAARHLAIAFDVGSTGPDRVGRYRHLIDACERALVAEETLAAAADLLGHLKTFVEKSDRVAGDDDKGASS